MICKLTVLGLIKRPVSIHIVQPRVLGMASQQSSGNATRGELLDAVAWNGKAVHWESNQGGIADCWADKALGLTTSVF